MKLPFLTKHTVTELNRDSHCIATSSDYAEVFALSIIMML